MTFKEQPAVLAAVGPRYPAPDWQRGYGMVTVVYVPDEGGVDGTVGWLVREGPALAFLTNAPPTHPGRFLVDFIDSELREGALGAADPAGVWDFILEHVPHTPPLERELSALIKEVHAFWGVT